MKQQLVPSRIEPAATNRRVISTVASWAVNSEAAMSKKSSALIREEPDSLVNHYPNLAPVSLSHSEFPTSGAFVGLKVAPIMIGFVFFWFNI